MPTKWNKHTRRTAPLNGAEQQQEATRKALRRSVARAKDIKRLARRLSRENDAAQKALLELAHDLLDDSQEDHLVAP